MLRNTLPLLFAALLASCSGGGGSTPAVAVATNAPTSAPIQQATSTPTNAPTSAPTQVPLSQRTIAGAPLSATASQLSRVRAQSRTTQAQGISASGLPILVESSGMVAAWAGDFGVWSSNISTGGDIAETAMTVTPSGNLPINNPAPAALSCLGVVSAMCAVHPMAFEWGTSSANGKPVGAQTLTVTFSDGTTGATHDYVYDGWNLPCNSGWAYVNGVPVAQATIVTSDVYADCIHTNIDLPKGGFILAQPTQDQYGRFETVMPTLTAQPLFAAANSVVPMASIGAGMVFAINTQDGGFAKVYFTAGSGVSGSGLNAGNGMSLHSQPNGTFAF